MSAASEAVAFLNALGTLPRVTEGFIPDKPNVIGTLTQYGGSAPQRGFGVTGIQYERPAFQVLFRGEPDDDVTPQTYAYLAWHAIAAIQPGVLGSTVWLQVDPRSSPYELKRDGNRRVYIACNYLAFKEPS